MLRIAPTALLALVAAVALAACGGDDEAGAPTAAATPPPGWTRFEGGGAELWLPASFVGGSPTEGDIELIKEGVRSLGPQFEALTQSIGQALAIFAFDTELGPATVAIVRAEVPSFITPDLYLDATLEQVGVLGTKLIERDQRTLSGFQAVRAVIETPIPGATARQLGYFIKTDDNAIWEVIFSTAADEFELRLPVFEQSIQTFAVQP